MATKKATLVHVDEDYIDMELSSSSNLFPYSIGSPPQNREFEFQMTSESNEKESTTSPADDLFYKGKLLPLHLPPRMKMVQKLLENSNATFEYLKSESSLEDSDFPFTTDLRMPSTNARTPLEHCKICPSESCRVSSDVNPDEYLLEWSSDVNGLVGDLPKKSWPKKLKQMKQFWLGQRLKASRAYLKALFSKSGCSDKSCASAANNVGTEKKSKCKDCQNKYVKVAKKNPFEIFYDNKHQISCAVMKTLKREMIVDDFCNHRRAFSGVVQRHCATKASSLSTSSSGSSSSSLSFSFSSAGYYDLQLFKRSISANSELESSVEGAIAHCKQSH
ncbi:probable membrane-associated kinase regulator 4 [Gastrolobium bilobum]|uniref:probable membrane-associated kinase regulator 4 n=1 Tax=Gastrolobium bilobum TaxID=150636 RepID=UPI002AB019D6|nr:probable membrane-associated kinase regulator 4 [Gastrolobium bilobum]